MEWRGSWSSAMPMDSSKKSQVSQITCAFAHLTHANTLYEQALRRHFSTFSRKMPLILGAGRRDHLLRIRS